MTYRVVYVRDPHEPGVMVGGVHAVPGDVVGGQGVEVHKPKHGNLVQSPYQELVFLTACQRCCYITVVSATTALQNKTVLAHIGAFPNKCTIKHPFHTLAA